MSYGIGGFYNGSLSELATVIEISQEGIIISLSSEDKGIIPLDYLERYNADASDFRVGESFGVFKEINKYKGGRKEEQMLNGLPVFKLSHKSNNGNIYVSSKLDRIKYGVAMVFECLSKEEKQEYLFELLWEMMWNDTDMFFQLESLCNNFSYKLDDKVKHIFIAKYVLDDSGSLTRLTYEVMEKMRRGEGIFCRKDEGACKVIDFAKYIEKKRRTDIEEREYFDEKNLLNGYSTKILSFEEIVSNKSSKVRDCAEETSNRELIHNNEKFEWSNSLRYMDDMAECLGCLVFQEESDIYYDEFIEIFLKYLNNFSSLANSNNFVEYVFLIIQKLETLEIDYPYVILLKPLIMEVLEQAAKYAMMKKELSVAAIRFYEYQRYKLIEYSDIIDDVELRLVSIDKKMLLPYMFSGKLQEAKRAGAEALEILSTLCKNDPEKYVGDYIEICSNLGGIYMDANELDMAYEIFFECVKKLNYFPKNVRQSQSYLIRATILSENITKLKEKILNN